MFWSRHFRRPHGISLCSPNVEVCRLFAHHQVSDKLLSSDHQKDLTVSIDCGNVTSICSMTKVKVTGSTQARFCASHDFGRTVCLEEGMFFDHHDVARHWPTAIQI